MEICVALLIFVINDRHDLHGTVLCDIKDLSVS